MNKTLVVILQLVLIFAYLGSVFFVYDSSTGMGLAQIGGTSAVVLILVLVLEKRKDKPADAGTEAVPAAQPASAEPVAKVPAQEAAPVEPVAEQPPQEQVPPAQ